MKQHLLESEEAAENGVDNYPHFPPFRQLEENEEPLHDFPQVLCLPKHSLKHP